MLKIMNGGVPSQTLKFTALCLKSNLRHFFISQKKINIHKRLEIHQYERQMVLEVNYKPNGQAAGVVNGI